MTKKKTKHNVHEGLLPLLVPIDSVTHDPRNARAHDRRNLASIKDSYDDHGQRKPLVAKLPERYITAGNGQLEAARALGWTHIAVLFVEEDETDARKYALRDNRSGELAHWDLEALGRDLRYLDERGVPLETIGWEEFEYAPLMAADWSPPEDDDDSFRAPEKRVSLLFTKPQWEKLTDKLAAKPSADLVLKALGVE